MSAADPSNPAAGSPGSLAVGPLAVRIDQADAAALAWAVAPDGAEPTVPLIFPIRWLALPQIHRALSELVDLSTVVLVHEAQGFVSAAPLCAGVDYVLAARLTRSEGAAARVMVTGTMRDAAGVDVGELHATLRILPRGAAIAGAAQ